MKLSTFWLVALVYLAPVAGGTEKAPELLYQQAWYIEEGLRDPSTAATRYIEIASEFPDNKPIAAKALSRAAGCYKKLGREDLERDIWKQAWRDYKEEIEKSPEYQHDSIRIRSKIEKDLAAGSPSDIARAFSDILDGMPAVHIIPTRDGKLKEAEEQREQSPLDAVTSLRIAILLSIKIKDEATAAAAQSKIGEIWLEQKRFVDAVEAYLEARRDYPNQRSVLAGNQMKMAEAFRLMDRTPDALDYYAELMRTYIEQKEQTLWGKLWMGDCHRELGRFETAEKVWREVAENEDAKDSRQWHLARILVGLEEPPATLDATTKDEFTNDEAYFVAVRYEMNGDLETARNMLELTRKLSIGKDWPFMLATHYLASGRLGDRE